MTMGELVVDGPDLFVPGEAFRGYVVERLLGKGGIGGVYLVRHQMLDTLFAMKAVYPEVAEKNPELVKRFLREAKIATRIRHPNLVSVHDCGYDEAKGLYYLVMDYVSGGDLRQALAFAGKIETKRAMDIVVQLTSALEAAQKFHVVHRDIKPENVMIDPGGNVKLVDLGVAKVDNMVDTLKTTAKSVFGTPGYVAPEQAVDSSDVDVRADIYSLGVILFEMLCGKRPYEGTNPAQILSKLLGPDPVPDVRTVNPDVPATVAALVARMCEKDREKRIPSTAALLGAFESIGYELPEGVREQRAEYAVEEQPETSIGDELKKLPKQSNPTLSFETDDADVREFVRQLKAKRRRGKWLMPALVGAALLLVVLLIIFL